MENIQSQDMYIVCGEVQAKISYKENKKIFLNQGTLRDTGAFEKKYAIKFKKFQINFNKTLSKFKIYDTIYMERNFKMFSNLYFPISIVEIINKEQEFNRKKYSKQEAVDIGIKELKESILKKIKNKDNIYEEFVDVKENNDYVNVYLTYVILENIETYEKIKF